MVRLIQSDRKLGERSQIEASKRCVIGAGNKRDCNKCGHSPAAFCQSRFYRLDSLAGRKPWVYLIMDAMLSREALIVTQECCDSGSVSPRATWRPRMKTVVTNANRNLRWQSNQSCRFTTRDVRKPMRCSVKAQRRSLARSQIIKALATLLNSN